MSWLNPEYATSFYHLSRHPELVVTKDRDIVAFFADTVTLAPTDGMGVWRDSTKATLQWQTASPITVAASERLLLWGRVGGTETASAFRWVPYVVGSDSDTQEIKPLREVFAPRVIYDRSSNMLHLWFWTNVSWAYNGTDYDEAQLYPIGTSNYNSHTGTVGSPQSKVKRVLCYAVGRFEHFWVEGGYVGGYSGSVGDTTEYDLIPIFSRPKILTNYTPSSGTGPGLITDGWYPANRPFHFELVQQSDTVMGVRCGYRGRNGYFAQTPKDGGGNSYNLNDFWKYTFTGAAGTYYLGFQFKQDIYSHCPELIPDNLEAITPTTTNPTTLPASDDPFDRKLWVGWVQWDGSKITDYGQWWWGGNEDTEAEVPDSNYTGSGGYNRKTIERNPDASSHKDELQLRNVHTCYDSTYSMPFFLSGTTTFGMLPGELFWAALDSHLAVTPSSDRRSSLEILTSPLKVAQIYGFATGTGSFTPNDTSDRVIMRRAYGMTYPRVDYCSPSALVGSVIQHLFNGSAQTGTANYLAGFSNGGTGIIIGHATINWTGGQIIHSGVGPPAGQIQNVTTGSSGSVTIDIYYDSMYKYKHTNLDFSGSGPGYPINASGNVDHDQRYIAQGDEYDKSFFGVSIGAISARNVPGMLSGGEIRIHLWNYELHKKVGIASVVTANWSSCVLNSDSTGAKLSVDWQNRKTVDISGNIANYTMDWQSCILRNPASPPNNFWSVQAGTLFKVLDTTPWSGMPTNGTGALQVSGGINFLDKSGGVKGSFGCVLLDTDAAVSAFGGLPSPYSAKLGQADCAGYFYGGTGSVKLSGPGPCVNATGSIEATQSIKTATDFWAGGNQGKTVSDWFNGGILIKAVTKKTIQYLDWGGLPQSVVGVFE